MRQRSQTELKGKQDPKGAQTAKRRLCRTILSPEPISDARCRQRGQSPFRDLCSAKRLSSSASRGGRKGRAAIWMWGMAERSSRFAAAVFEDLDIGVASIRLESPDPIANRRPGQRRVFVGKVDRFKSMAVVSMTTSWAPDPATRPPKPGSPPSTAPMGTRAGYLFGTTRTRHPGPSGVLPAGRMAAISGGVSILVARAEGAGFPVVLGAGFRASRHKATGPAAPIGGDQDNAAAYGIAADFRGRRVFPPREPLGIVRVRAQAPVDSFKRTRKVKDPMAGSLKRQTGSRQKPWWMMSKPFSDWDRVCRGKDQRS